MSGVKINRMVLVKAFEKYVFLYDDESLEETLRTLRQFSANPELSFTWYDTVVLSQKILKVKQRQEAERQRERTLEALKVLAKRRGLPLP